MWRVEGLVRGAVEAGQAAFAVDAGGVVLAVNAHTPSLVDVVLVLAGVAPGHLGVVVTGVGVAVAVTGLALVGAVGGGRLPGLLVEAGAAAVTGAPTRVVLTGTLQPERLCGVGGITDVRMAVADAAAADADVLDAIIIPAGDRGSRSALPIRWPSSVLVRRKRRRMLVALVKSRSSGEKEKFMAPGRPFTSDTTISPFSRGTMREYSVVQTASSSRLTRSSVRAPKRSRQSLLEEAKNCHGW